VNDIVVRRSWYEVAPVAAVHVRVTTLFVDVLGLMDRFVGAARALKVIQAVAGAVVYIEFCTR
jgi:hypothetical protein